MTLELSACQLTKIDEGGFIGAQIGALGGDESGASPDQLSHTFGFVSRPLDPVDGVGCSIFSSQAGSSERFCWLADDPRLVDKYPQTKKGGSCQYASDGSFASFDPETHTWTLYVPYASDPAKAHLVTVGKDGNDTPMIELASGEGPSITILDTVTTIKNATGSAYVVLDDSGTSVVGPFKAAGGADLGGTLSEPLAKFAALSAQLTAVQATLVALAAAVTAIAAVPVNSSAGTAPAAAAATAVGLAQAALATFGTAGITLTTKGA